MNITFEEFKKVEVRIGLITKCEKVENADKLLKLQVDFGEFQRQIVSAIAEYYKSEELEGKKKMSSIHFLLITTFPSFGHKINT